MKEKDIVEKLIGLKKEVNTLSQKEVVQLIAVSKTKPVSDIEAALKANHRLFGENKVQEAAEKWPELKQRYPDVQLHLIGGLQKNKVRKAIGLFDVIQTLDRKSLAEAIARISIEEAKIPQLYIQINIGREPQKSGILPEEVEDFYQYCSQDLGLKIIGLMAIPPVGEDAKAYFVKLKEYQKMLSLPYLSMGMSADYREAIKQGATHIRLGQAIFGGR
ncbi:MAG: YggS family pyridoxal phosphate-dependent enzyme [Alphaproteobacteria bacterium]